VDIDACQRTQQFFRKVLLGTEHVSLADYAQHHNGDSRQRHLKRADTSWFQEKSAAPIGGACNWRKTKTVKVGI
jgi:hypothetical protein